MTVYIDNNYICHTDNADGRRAVEVSALDGMCALKVETYRFIPAGERWGTFSGEALLPAADPRPSDVVQKQYEADEAQRWGSLGIPQESSFTSTSNHVEGEFLSVQGKLYKCVYPIPATCTIVPGMNIVPATMEEYLESIKEG